MTGAKRSPLPPYIRQGSPVLTAATTIPGEQVRPETVPETLDLR